MSVKLPFEKLFLFHVILISQIPMSQRIAEVGLYIHIDVLATDILSIIF